MVKEPTGKKPVRPLPEMAQLAKLLMKVGPDIDKIARISGQYKETIRYRYKEKILAKGFAVQARVSYEGLSLQRVIMKVAVNETYVSYARELFLVMNKLCYVTGFTRLLPEDTFMLHAAVPKEFTEAFIRLVNNIKALGIFDSVEFYTFDWFRSVPMRAEFYNFEQGVWEYDWTSVVEPNDDEGAMDVRPFTFDKMDLLILKELQSDATRSLSDIRDTIKEVDGIDINYKTLAWHWVRHVQEKKMIKGYALRWMGTGYDFNADKAKHRQHKYAIVSVFVRGVSNEERANLIGQVNKVPFLWAEAAGEDYYAQFAFPVEMVNDAFSFLRDTIARYGKRASYHIADQTNAVGYTFSYELFDDQERRWRFEEAEVLARFQNLVVKIRGGSG